MPMVIHRAFQAKKTYIGYFRRKEAFDQNAMMARNDAHSNLTSISALLGAHLGQLIGSIQTNPRSLVFFENPGFHL
jgi:hypothetical protein